jgi:hypothetical protein
MSQMTILFRSTAVRISDPSVDDVVAIGYISLSTNAGN